MHSLLLYVPSSLQLNRNRSFRTLGFCFVKPQSSAYNYNHRYHACRALYYCTRNSATATVTDGLVIVSRCRKLKILLCSQCGFFSSAWLLLCVCSSFAYAEKSGGPFGAFWLIFFWNDFPRSITSGQTLFCGLKYPFLAIQQQLWNRIPNTAVYRLLQFRVLSTTRNDDIV